MADTIGITEAAGGTSQVAADELVDPNEGGQTVKVQIIKLMDGTADSTNRAFIGSNGAQAMMLATDGISSAGVLVPPKKAIANINPSTTGGTVVASVAGKKIRVLQLYMGNGATATNITFNTSSGAAISPVFLNDVYGGAVLPFSPMGWFETLASEGLTATTTAGSVTGVVVGYVEV